MTADWMEHAACQHAPDPDAFFRATDHPRMVALYCNHCPVTAQCAALGHEVTAAYSWHIKDGSTWGGQWIGTDRAKKHTHREPQIAGNCEHCGRSLAGMRASARYCCPTHATYQRRKKKEAVS